MSLPDSPVLVYADAANPWFSWQFLQENQDAVLSALREHASLTAEAVALAALVAIPLAVLGYWFRPLTAPILALTGVLYTIPSLALFALLAPFLPGRVTVLVGLVTYALLVITRNAVAGLTQVPEPVRDAARGMGYGRLAQLWRIELPLALPGILTGLRLATVSTVALVTVGVLNGHGALGEFLTAGFRAGYRAEITTATIIIFSLGLVLDLVLAGVGRLLTPWARRRAA
ncbi:MAG: quaternary ammonium transporter [Actinobacteria bacterium 13_1_20CM_3_71_11]|nr:MAG: quaternary ammonium transporter [Actinobacteria bacterium 13_1_20CM_3_71_11]TML33212.1 MAG: ABC transporter permease [Actinomycetota bacterium]